MNNQKPKLELVNCSVCCDHSVVVEENSNEEAVCVECVGQSPELLKAIYKNHIKNVKK